MNRILSLIFLLIFASCVNKGLIETNQKKIYLSNTKILYDMKKSSFKMDFSINNQTSETITNFVYQVIFIDKKLRIIIDRILFISHT